MVALIPTEVGILKGRSRRTDRTRSRARGSNGSRMRRTTLTKGVQGGLIWNWRRRRGFGDCIDTPAQG